MTTAHLPNFATRFTVLPRLGRYSQKKRKKDIFVSNIHLQHFGVGKMIPSNNGCT